MNTNGISDHHWLRVGRHFAVDAVIFYLAFMVGISLRFADEWNMLLMATWDYWPSILVGTIVFPCTAYILGLYSTSGVSHGIFKRSLGVLFCLSVAVLFMVGAFYVHFTGRIGRGAMLLGGVISYFSLLIHHGLLVRRRESYRERVVFIVTSEFDEAEVTQNEALWREHLHLVGIVHDDNFHGTRGQSLGSVADLPDIVRRCNISRVLCTNQSMNNRALCKLFCQLRYSGVTVMPLISLCEEVHHLVPVELITPEWLLNASGSPEMIYIKKIKRGFDIVSSLIGLVCLSPFMFAGIVAIKLTSPGPAFYFQTRCGRFGRSMRMIKLRSMAVDAEKNGAVWAQANDPRASRVGAILRKYRIDEIPQLINVLRGEMSLVGPRPERPEFVEELSRQIPFYQERLMVQPGITGWAQVNYPYGASLEDTQRKLEYDLYYMKHMSLALDLFILLDTIRIILRGGLGEAHKQATPRYASSHRPSPAVPMMVQPASVPVPSNR
jgi:exopolysaccharide biosynthesis polyprenyl glycosylphosphotransferase